MTSGFRPVGARDVHQGHLWNVVVGTFEAPDGTTFERDLVRSPGAVGIVPVLFDPRASRRSCSCASTGRPSTPS